MSYNGTSISDISISTETDKSYSNSSMTTAIDPAYWNNSSSTALEHSYTNNSPFGTVFTINNTGTGPITTDSSWVGDTIYYPSKVDTALTVNGDATIKGKLKIGDKDIGELLSAIESRLAILTPNPGLEEKWNSLRELGDKYRQLEKEIIEQEELYKILSR